MKNKNGFTLIEIIVSIMIASIGMLIATTIILNSMGYFDKTVAADNDKQILDGIKNYIQNELMYASDVRIQSTYPEKSDGSVDEGNWHYLFIKDNKLYRDQDCDSDFTKSNKVYGDDYYNNRKVFVQTRGMGDYRIDLKFYITDRNGVDTSYRDDYQYKTSSTIELLNFKAYVLNKNGISYLKDVKNLQSLNNDSSFNGIKLFYKQEGMPIDTDSNESNATGTVADQIGCIGEEILNDATDKYKFKDGNYNKGDFVYIIKNGEKKWFMCLATAWYQASELEGQNKFSWKSLQAEFQEQSGYLAGDIVIYNGNYYECMADRVNNGSGSIWIPTNSPSNWKKIDKPVNTNKKCGLLKINEYPEANTVARQNENGYGNLESFSQNSFYNENSMVSVGNPNNPVRSEIWKKVKTDTNNQDISEPGKKNKNGYYTWRDFSLDWQIYNGYFKDDVIRYYDDSFYKAKESIIDGTPPINTDGTVSSKWQKVKISGNSWIIDYS